VLTPIRQPKADSERRERAAASRDGRDSVVRELRPGLSTLPVTIAASQPNDADIAMALRDGKTLAGCLLGLALFLGLIPAAYLGIDRAAEIIRPSVVRVVGYGTEKTTPEAKTEKRGRNMAKGKPPEATDEVPGKQVERGVGTGVVIVDKGVILTNLHVVAGAESIRVTFADGLEAPATITALQPENDLAVLQAQKLPDDLIPATMRSTADLMPGDQVVAVGFPFGIGPSVSAGVVSGLNRSFRSPEGKQELGNLIQFDAAANPGNSGGPLINMDGEVLGIVTAILNPTQQRTFIGIGFAVPIENAATAAGSPPF